AKSIAGNFLHKGDSVYPTITKLNDSMSHVYTKLIDRDNSNVTRLFIARQSYLNKVLLNGGNPEGIAELGDIQLTPSPLLTDKSTPETESEEKYPWSQRRTKG